MDLLTKQTPKAFRKPVGLEVKLLQAVSYNHWTVFLHIGSWWCVWIAKGSGT